MRFYASNGNLLSKWVYLDALSFSCLFKIFAFFSSCVRAVNFAGTRPTFPFLFPLTVAVKRLNKRRNRDTKSNKRRGAYSSKYGIQNRYDSKTIVTRLNSTLKRVLIGRERITPLGNKTDSTYDRDSGSFNCLKSSLQIPVPARWKIFFSWASVCLSVCLSVWPSVSWCLGPSGACIDGLIYICRRH